MGPVDCVGGLRHPQGARSCPFGAQKWPPLTACQGPGITGRGSPATGGVKTLNFKQLGPTTKRIRYLGVETSTHHVHCVIPKSRLRVVQSKLFLPPHAPSAQHHPNYP